MLPNTVQVCGLHGACAFNKDTDARDGRTRPLTTADLLLSIILPSFNIHHIIS